jgi:2-methylcitrate dehydratase PrpD
MEFCMAILLLDGKAGLPQFTDETVRRPDVQKMIERIDFHVHPEAEAAGYDRMTTIITIRLKDGQTVSGRADFGKGSPADPMSYDDVAEKFRGCAEAASWPEAKTAAIIDAVRQLQSLADIRELTALCAR